MIKFTRLLYAYDEVIINLLFAIIERKDFNKVIFWSSELFYSGFLRELSDITWKIYYHFYALKIPFYKINSKCAKFTKTNNFVYLLEVYNVLFQVQPNCEIFIITQMYKHKKIAKINDISKIFNIITALLKTKKMFHIINYLKEALFQDEQGTIKEYNIFIKKVNDKASPFRKNKKSSYVFSQLMNHFIINTNLFIKKSQHKRVKYKKFCNSYIEYFKQLNIHNNHSIQILAEKRKYAIDDKTGIFKLQRQEIEQPMSNIFWYNWEYYSKHTPYWQEKYNKYNVTWDEKNIIFPNDDKLEDFYDHYNYELDELPFEVSNKSIKSISNEISILEFLYLHFKVINIPLENNKIDIKNKIKY